MYLSIIIPVYNEESTICEVLQALKTIHLPLNISTYEVIIIEDHSKDKSKELISDFIKDLPNFRLFEQPKNMGKGAAVRKGFELAKGDIFLIQDGDLELSPDDIPSMINAMTEMNVEFVNGSRYLSGVIRPVSSYRRYIINKIFTIITSILINVNITNLACGYKLIHRNIISKIKLKENRFGIEAELIVKALRLKKNNIVEVPVKYFPRNMGEGKKIRNIDGLRILWTIIKYGLFKL